MPLVVTKQWYVSGVHLIKPLTLRDDDIEWVNMPRIDGSLEKCMYIKLRKKDNSTERLVLGHARNTKNKNDELARTQVLEQLMALRDETRGVLIEQHLKLLEETARADRETHMQGKIDISFESPTCSIMQPSPKKMKFSQLDQDFVSICAPSQCGIDGIEIKAKIEPIIAKSNPRFLSVHLTEEILGYIHSVAMYEVSNGIHKKHPRTLEQPLVGAVGLSRVHSGKHQGKYRYKNKILEAATDNEAVEKVQQLLEFSISKNPVQESDNESAITDEE